jgi:hypothetical protein
MGLIISRVEGATVYRQLAAIHRFQEGIDQPVRILDRRLAGIDPVPGHIHRGKTWIEREQCQ